MVPVLVFGSSLGFWELSVRHLSVQITFPDLDSLSCEKPWSEACVCSRLLERCGTTRSKMVFTQSKRPAAAAGGSTGKT